MIEANGQPSHSKSKEKSYWFFLEPYVHLTEKGDRYFLYNTLNGKYLICKKKYNRPVAKIVRQWLNKNNLYVCTVKQNDLRDVQLNSFVKKIRMFFMGDLLPKEMSQGKPIQIVPKAAVLLTPEKVQQHSLTYVKEISFYVNSKCSLNCNYCRDAYKQFLCCSRFIHSDANIDIALLKKALNSITLPKLFKINILGGDIFSFPAILEMADFLSKTDAVTIFHTNARNLAGNFNKALVLKKIFPHNQKYFFRVFIDLLIYPDELLKINRFLLENEMEFDFSLIVQKEDEVEKLQILLSKLKIDNFQFKPYFNGRNLRFFQKNVFTAKYELLKSKPPIQDILVKKLLNSANFGKLIVLSNLDVYANINRSPIGVLNKESLIKCLQSEIAHRYSWRLTRDLVEPCRHCIFEMLCPPVSDYELVMKKHNLCRISVKHGCGKESITPEALH